MIGGESPDDGIAIGKFELFEGMEFVENELAFLHPVVQRFPGPQPHFALHARAGRRRSVNRQRPVTVRDGSETEAVIQQIRRLEVVFVRMGDDDVADFAHHVPIPLPCLQRVRAEVDLDGSAEVVTRPASDFRAAPCGRFATDAAVAEERWNPFGGGRTEEKQFGCHVCHRRYSR